MRQIISILLVILTVKTIGQTNTCFDSLDFFTRTKTRKITAKIFYNKTLMKESVGTFDRSSNTIQWCGTIVNNLKGCSDPEILNINANPKVVTNLTVHEYQFDKLGRTIKVLTKFTGNNQYNITQYYYSDSLSKRIRLIIEEASNSSISTYNYHYSNNRLVEIIETFINLSSIEEQTKPTTFEYYPDGRPKTETTIKSKTVSRVTQYTYQDF